MAGRVLIEAPYIDQTKDWPTGCESVSAVMLLQYLGYNISVEKFVDEYLEKAPLHEKEGKLYGPDPWKVFAGNPRDDKSMGCYAPVIRKALEKVFRGEKRETAQNPMKGKESLLTVDLTGIPMEKLLADYIDHEIPVIFWASIDLKETVNGPDWILEETGKVFSWRSNEHCMLFVGYDDENYFFNDPWHDHGTVGYERELVERRHKEQYGMAVSIKMNNRRENI